MEKELFERLTQAIKGMREAQQSYFRFRSPDLLRTAKRWEKEVDNIIEEIDKVNQPKQQSLF